MLTRCSCIIHARYVALAAIRASYEVKVGSLAAFALAPGQIEATLDALCLDAAGEESLSDSLRSIKVSDEGGEASMEQAKALLKAAVVRSPLRSVQSNTR